METGVKIIVKGMVQGIGYRFFVLRAARNLNLNGYVKNLWNGNVEVVAEGDRGAVEELIQILKVGPRMASVRNLTVQWVEPQGKFTSFRIEF
ncbi:acylphosphatase [candidate division KSB1 bacterium]|nr:acylphosphatase [candidate division KSB1 bacterium]